MNQNDIEISDVESYLIELRSAIEQELAKTPLTEMAIIAKLERRSQNLWRAIDTIQSETSYSERGMCFICGSIGDGRKNNKVYCGFHGAITEGAFCQ